MSNCFKHAFADATAGRIRVTLRSDRHNNMLTVADNGVGFPPGFDFRNSPSFGLQLVNTLVEQLQGRIELNTDHGSAFVVTFPTRDNGHHGTSP
jgi:two-component sensor histidine kinase